MCTSVGLTHAPGCINTVSPKCEPFCCFLDTHKLLGFARSTAAPSQFGLQCHLRSRSACCPGCQVLYSNPTGLGPLISRHCRIASVTGMVRRACSLQPVKHFCCSLTIWRLTTQCKSNDSSCYMKSTISSEPPVRPSNHKCCEMCMWFVTCACRHCRCQPSSHMSVWERGRSAMQEIYTQL